MPDYFALVKFLIEPLLEQPDAIRVDCETNAKGDRTWVRVAFAASDKGRVFGRGGRTIQAIRTVLTTAAQLAGQTVCFDIYDPDPTAKFSDKPTHKSNDREVKQERVRSPIRRKRVD